MAENQVKKVSWWMERLADWMIANPHLRMQDAAKEFNVSPAWLSVVKNSDCFKEYFAQKSEKASEAIIATVRDKTVAITEIALDHFAEKLNKEAEFMPLKDLMEVVDLGLTKLGYGANKTMMPPPVSVVAQNVLITSGDLARAREKAMEASGIPSKQINQEVALLEAADVKVA